MPIKSPRRESFQSLGEALSEAPFQRNELLAHLVPAAQTTVFVADSSIGLRDTRVFAHILTYAIAAEKTFPPFGTGRGVPTVFGAGEKDCVSCQKERTLIADKDLADSTKKRANNNLHFLDRYADEVEQMFLNTTEGQRMVRQRLKSKELLVIHNLPVWIKRDVNKAEESELIAWCAQLNAAGIAVVLFEPAGLVDAKNIHQLKHSNIVRLTVDSAAPREIGGGFNIVRSKADFDDPIPSKIQFWYKVFDGALDFGYEHRDSGTDVGTAKQVEIYERRIEVARLLPSLPQKLIAEKLKVDAATISRDATIIKAKERVVAGNAPRKTSSRPNPDDGAQSADPESG